jgi:hypothetical protein
MESHAQAVAFFPFALSIFLAVPAYLLAKEKGRSVAWWVILGIIPGVNFLSMWFFVGAANLRLEQKIDAVLERGGESASR